MANSIKSFNEALASSNSTLESKGQVLADFDKFIVNGEKKTFKQLAVRSGFWFSLGELMENLLQDSGGSRIDSAKLKDAKIHNVNKRRRQEAHKFFTNFEKIEELNLVKKHGSLGRLLADFDKSQKPKVETPVEPQDEVKQIEDKSSVQSVKTVSDIATEAMAQCALLEGNPRKELLATLAQMVKDEIGLSSNEDEVIPFKAVG
tara:strand:- start:372 stop:983 length:612 start_codon:yes stop_codon:yes gene_type:complete